MNDVQFNDLVDNYIKDADDFQREMIIRSTSEIDTHLIKCIKLINKSYVFCSNANTKLVLLSSKIKSISDFGASNTVQVSVNYIFGRTLSSHKQTFESGLMRFMDALINANQIRSAEPFWSLSTNMSMTDISDQMRVILKNRDNVLSLIHYGSSEFTEMALCLGGLDLTTFAEEENFRAELALFTSRLDPVTQRHSLEAFRGISIDRGMTETLRQMRMVLQNPTHLQVFLKNGDSEYVEKVLQKCHLDAHDTLKHEQIKNGLSVLVEYLRNINDVHFLKAILLIDTKGSLPETVKQIKNTLTNSNLLVLIEHGNKDFLYYIISLCCINLIARDADNNTLLHLAVKNGSSTETLSYLINHGLRVDSRNHKGWQQLPKIYIFLDNSMQIA